MKGFLERTVSSKYYSNSSACSPNRIPGSICSEPGSNDSKLPKSSLWSSFTLPAFSIFETLSEPKGCGKKASSSRSNGWTAAFKRVMNGGGSMRKIQERVLGLNRTGHSVSAGDIWLLGVCYKISLEDSSGDPAQSEGYAAFVEDFSSRILITYRKGFANIGDSKYSSDVYWGCMLRSSQMLVAQALLFQRLGRSWRKSLHKPVHQHYIDILHLFGDCEESAFSIHNLLEAGKAYDLAPGSWVGPYAMCRTWETLARCRTEETELDDQSFPLAIYVVSGDEDGERGGAPVLCIEDILSHCFEFSGGQVDGSPILLLVPLVLGLDKVNTRYVLFVMLIYMIAIQLYFLWELYFLLE
ncbi:unnamed protein product [Ilex paraguariensis]|uniref:Cysteine protease n=1 Tax=Ilex paraguariensis TaxID=185542 RepID=A0ABC8RGC9_9AQUA